MVLLAGAIWVTWRGPRTDSARASLIIFGGWLLSTGVTFAYMQGTIHPYYTVALAPAIGALVGIGSVLLWRHRAVAPRVAYGVLALTVVVTCGWGFELLRTDASFHPSVRYLAVAAAVAAVVAAGRSRRCWTRDRAAAARGDRGADRGGGGGADCRLGGGDGGHAALRVDSHRGVRERERRVLNRVRRRLRRRWRSGRWRRGGGGLSGRRPGRFRRCRPGRERRTPDSGRPRRDRAALATRAPVAARDR